MSWLGWSHNPGAVLRAIMREHPNLVDPRALDEIEAFCDEPVEARVLKPDGCYLVVEIKP